MKNFFILFLLVFCSLFFTSLVSGHHDFSKNLSWNAFFEVGAVGDSSTLVVKNTDNPFAKNWSWIFWLTVIVILLIWKIRLPIFAWLIIFLGGFLFSFTMFRSGSPYDFGLGFWGPNGHDGVWHLSLMENMTIGSPLDNPVFAGSRLSNYHWGFDLVSSLIGRLLRIPFLDLYFRFLPLLFAFLIGVLSFYLGKVILGNFSTGAWFLILNYLAGSFGWLASLFRYGKIGGESLFWSMQSVSTLLNPPYALSLIFLLLGLVIWLQPVKDKPIFKAIVVGLIFGFLSLIKVYAGILVGLTFFSIWLYKVVFRREKIYSPDLVLWLTIGLVSLLSLWLMGALSSGSMLVFKPLWFTHSLIESLDKLYLPKLATLRINLAQDPFSFKLPVLLAIEVGLILIFLLGNAGSRLLGFLTFRKRASKGGTNLEVFSMFFLGYSFLIPMLFVQRGTTWNTIQFFYYFLFLLNFYFAIFLDEMTRKRIYFEKMFAITAFLLVLPTTFSTLKDYFGFPPPASIPSQELYALDFLKNQTEGVVLVFPYDHFKKDDLATPLPLYLYETTAYVSAFSRKKVFLEDEMNLEITGFSWRERKAEVERFFSSEDNIWAKGFLLNNRIDYLYLVNDQNFRLLPEELGLKMIFNNGQAKIYQVLK